MSNECEFAEFEICDRYGARWRYKKADGYRWNFGLVAASLDTEDKNMIEVWLNSTDQDEESQCVAWFPFAAMVGDVTSNIRRKYMGWNQGYTIYEATIVAAYNTGKLHGYCVVCGVPWPCEYAGKPPAARSRDNPVAERDHLVQELKSLARPDLATPPEMDEPRDQY